MTDRKLNEEELSDLWRTTVDAVGDFVGSFKKPQKTKAINYAFGNIEDLVKENAKTRFSVLTDQQAAQAIQNSVNMAQQQQQRIQRAQTRFYRGRAQAGKTTPWYTPIVTGIQRAYAQKPQSNYVFAEDISNKAIDERRGGVIARRKAQLAPIYSRIKTAQTKQPAAIATGINQAQTAATTPQTTAANAQPANATQQQAQQAQQAQAATTPQTTAANAQPANATQQQAQAQQAQAQQAQAQQAQAQQAQANSGNQQRPEFELTSPPSDTSKRPDFELKSPPGTVTPGPEQLELDLQKNKPEADPNQLQLDLQNKPDANTSQRYFINLVIKSIVDSFQSKPGFSSAWVKSLSGNLISMINGWCNELIRRNMIMQPDQVKKMKEILSILYDLALRSTPQKQADDAASENILLKKYQNRVLPLEELTTKDNQLSYVVKYKGKPIIRVNKNNKPMNFIRTAVNTWQPFYKWDTASDAPQIMPANMTVNADVLRDLNNIFRQLDTERSIPEIGIKSQFDIPNGDKNIATYTTTTTATKESKNYQQLNAIFEEVVKLV